MTATKKILLLVIGLVLSYSLGVWGLYTFLKAQNPDTFVLPSALYYALQMLFLNVPNFSEQMPIPFVIGRSLSGIIFALVSAKVVYVLLYKEITNLRLIFIKDHLVICGLGDIGLPIAFQAREKGANPVVIVHTFEESIVKSLAKKGIPVIVGNPSDKSVLSQAKASRAKTVMALCEDDDWNTEIAYQLNTLNLSVGSAEKLECILFLKSISLLAALQGLNFFPHNDPAFSINIRSLNMYAFCARTAFSGIPYNHLSLYKDSGKQPQIIIIGFGNMGQSIAVQAAKIAHFPSGGKLKIHVIDEHAKKRMDQIRNNYPNFHLVADMEEIEGVLEDPNARKRVIDIYKNADKEGSLMTCVICDDEEETENLVQSLSLVNELHESQTPILVYQTSASGFSQLLRYKAGGHNIQNQLIPFGMTSELWSFEAIKDEKQDQLAKALHKIYLDDFECQENGIDAQKNPSQLPWDRLNESFRESNRSAADHIPVKLAVLGLKTCPFDNSVERENIPKLDETQVEILSKIEHARWCAERWLSGWTYGSVRDNSARIHPDLVEWDKLRKESQYIDKRIMSSIHRALETVGEGIVSV
ncbi:MAG: NAD-binding protein [Proteobacteria bacterium]|nr:NAD-binding protein [Pseudomonadota bacterium]